MEILLVRHGIAEERDSRKWADDRGRPLTRPGTRKFRSIARILGKAWETPDLVLSSPLARAWQTAQILEEVCGWPEPEGIPLSRAGRKAGGDHHRPEKAGRNRPRGSRRPRTLDERDPLPFSEWVSRWHLAGNEEGRGGAGPLRRRHPRRKRDPSVAPAPARPAFHGWGLIRPSGAFTRERRSPPPALPTALPSGRLGQSG